MSGSRNPDVAIRPWAEDDLPLLMRLLGDPAMMEHLGGADTAEAISARHQRYLTADPARGGVFAIVVGPDAEPVGWVGYWELEWRGAVVWECGWHVVREHQGRGIATAATALALEHAHRRGLHRDVHAFPSVDNAASNAVCRTLGFTCLEEVEVEYPIGRKMRTNDWCLDLDSAFGD